MDHTDCKIGDPACGQLGQRRPADIRGVARRREASADGPAQDIDDHEMVADAAVRIGPGQWGKLVSHRITDVTGTVVAAPELAARAADGGHSGALPVVCLDRLEEHTRRTLDAAGVPTLTAFNDPTRAVDFSADVAANARR